jgi:hypothetical protein
MSSFFNAVTKWNRVPSQRKLYVILQSKEALHLVEPGCNRAWTARRIITQGRVKKRLSRLRSIGDPGRDRNEAARVDEWHGTKVFFRNGERIDPTVSVCSRSSGQTQTRRNSVMRPIGSHSATRMSPL